MEYVSLGNTGIKVSRLCFGALTIGPLQANLSLQRGAALIRYGLERGINFIDTAKMYGTYPHIKKALQGWDRTVVISSKSYDYTWEGMANSLEEARLATGRDYIDIFMLHEQESAQTMDGHKPALEYLWEAKTKGLVKAVGISTHTVNAVKAASERDEIEVIHPIVNMRGLGISDGNLEQMLENIKNAHQKGKGIYGMKPLGGGNLINQTQEALEFVFRLSCLHSVAVGCKIKEELDYNLAILEGVKPPEELVEKLKTVPRVLSIADWCAGCGACVKKCPSGLLEVKEGKARLRPDKEGCLFCGYCAAVCPEFAIRVG